MPGCSSGATACWPGRWTSCRTSWPRAARWGPSRCARWSTSSPAAPWPRWAWPAPGPSTSRPRPAPWSRSASGACATTASTSSAPASWSPRPAPRRPLRRPRGPARPNVPRPGAGADPPVHGLFRRKPLTQAVSEVETGITLRRTLGATQLTVLGVGAIVGAGILSSIGEQAAAAGPAVTLSYVVTALACAFAALCYAEIAAMVPVAGSAYTYAYVAMGELIAWIIGWDLIIEYAIGNIYVAQSWSVYFGNFMREALGVDF